MEDLRFNKPIEEQAEPIKSVEPIQPEPVGLNNAEEEGKADLVKPKIWQRIKKIKKLHIFLVLILLVIIILAGMAAKFYLKSQVLQSEVQANTTNEIQKIVAEVGKLIVLPKNEEPTVATISDVEKLQNQPFFANAKNGDKVLIYVKAQKAIIYDPVAKLIVDVAPLSGTPQNTAAKTP